MGIIMLQVNSIISIEFNDKNRDGVSNAIITADIESNPAIGKNITTITRQKLLQNITNFSFALYAIKHLFLDYI